jgi:hypothetical protein
MFYSMLEGEDSSSPTLACSEQRDLQVLFGASELWVSNARSDDPALLCKTRFIIQRDPAAVARWCNEDATLLLERGVSAAGGPMSEVPRRLN